MPSRARDTAEFLAVMRELKERSGLTYRQLEERATARGEVLPRSTLAGVLRGTSPPRPELLAAFVRACGDEACVEEWLRARDRVAGRAPARRRDRLSSVWRDRLARLRRPLPVTALLAVTALAVLVPIGVWWSSKAASSRPELPTSPVRIRPVLADGLCLTDGFVSRYPSHVAVQRPCDAVAPQVTTLEAAGDDAVRIAWYRPDQGKGCLTVLTGGQVAGLLEPRDACGQASRFRLEAVGPRAADRYVFHGPDDTCLGVRDAATTEGAEVLAQRCTGQDSQVFTVEPAS